MSISKRARALLGLHAAHVIEGKEEAKNEILALLQKVQAELEGYDPSENKPVESDLRELLIVAAEELNQFAALGIGTALGTVDLPIERGRHTEWPSIPGSSIKGILRGAAQDIIQEEIRMSEDEKVAKEITDDAAAHAESNEPGSYDKKRALVKKINGKCRAINHGIAHPETNEPCTILAINDNAEGKFILENKRTKKRSHTTRDIKTLLPFKLVAME